MKFKLKNLVRDNIKNLRPYASARHEFTGKASVFLDANENAFGSPLSNTFNRYPDPLQLKLKRRLSKLKGIPAGNICCGNGSDEIIDLAYRIFCDPGKDNVIICPPAYGMYAVNAHINDVEIRKADLTDSFQLDVKGILDATDSNTKLLFICSPNNPTGNSMNRADIEWLLKRFPGIVILDEAYIDYSGERSFVQDLAKYPNLMVMQTLSKAWGLAGLRLGLCYASVDIIELYNKVKPPYNINEASQQMALEALKNTRLVNNWVKEVNEQKEMLLDSLNGFSFVKKIYPSNANFILIRVDDAEKMYQYLVSKQIVVRNRSNEPNCQNCLRISIGTPGENKKLVTALKRYTS
jgi:histidinol-phosphate aminotransferase